jgi:hypothetical protein
MLSAFLQSIIIVLGRGSGQAIGFALCMKTWTSFIWIPGLALLMAWSPGGLAQNEIDHASTFVRDAPSILWPLQPDAYATSATNVSPRIRLSPWAREIVKLAQAGIDEGVILSFIDNSGMFNLGADQIIYLSDLGVPSDIVSEMLRHDAEVVAGVRRLTIASEPPRNITTQISFVTSSPASDKASAKSAATSALPVSAGSQLPVAPKPQPLAETDDRGIANDGQIAWGAAMTDEFNTTSSEAQVQQRHLSEIKGGYPVREPYPVQLTVPIIFVQAPERIPDTYIIEWFPDTDR